jgi:hypothetical protein
MALTMVVLGGVILIVELLRHHEPAELAVLAGLGGGAALAARWLLRDLRVHPAGFSEPDLRRP